MHIYIYTHVRIHFQFVELLHHFLREILAFKRFFHRLFKLCRPTARFIVRMAGIVLLRPSEGRNEIAGKIMDAKMMRNWPNHLFFSVNVSNNFKIWILLRSILPKLCSQVAKTTRVRHTWGFLLSNWHFKWSRTCDTQSMAVLIYILFGLGLDCSAKTGINQEVKK